MQTAIIFIILTQAHIRVKIIQVNVYKTGIKNEN